MKSRGAIESILKNYKLTLKFRHISNLIVLDVYDDLSETIFTDETKKRIGSYIREAIWVFYYEPLDKIQTVKPIHDKWISIRNNNAIRHQSQKQPAASIRSTKKEVFVAVDLLKLTSKNHWPNLTLKLDLQIRNPSINILDIKVPFDEFEKCTLHRSVNFKKYQDSTMVMGTLYACITNLDALVVGSLCS